MDSPPLPKGPSPLAPLSGQCLVRRMVRQAQLHQGTLVPEQPQQLLAAAAAPAAWLPAEAEALWRFSCEPQHKAGRR